jgi:membrane protein implicated in regulation of membrane protease activity
MTNTIAWLILLVVLVLIEFITLGLTTVWFAGGALAAFVVSIFIDNLILELVVFVIVSLLLLFFTRPIVIKHFNPKRVRTNYEELIGKEAVVTASIDNLSSTGLVRVNGQEWSARSADGAPIEKDTLVTIKDISGVKLIVSVKKEDA